MLEQFSRTALLLGTDACEQLAACSAAVFGVGGVGSYCCEALARGGVGQLTFIDHDTVSLTNLNRQLVALHSTLGRKKTDVMRERVKDINPSCVVETLDMFFCADNAHEIDFSRFDYVVDAIDSVSSKLLLAEKCKAAGTSLISCMGMGNKLDPTMIEVADISKTSVCPLARVMRRELKKRGITSLKVVYSTEPALTPKGQDEGTRPLPGSVSFVPSAAGLVIAGEVIKELAGRSKKQCLTD